MGARQIDQRIRRLAAEPFPATSGNLQNTVDVYRVRQGARAVDQGESESEGERG